jgi:hypothetical protein
MMHIVICLEPAGPYEIRMLTSTKKFFTIMITILGQCCLDREMSYNFSATSNNNHMENNFRNGADIFFEPSSRSGAVENNREKYHNIEGIL